MRRGLPRAPFLYPIVDLSLVAPERAPRWVEVLARTGAGLIQIRAKAVEERAFLEAACACAQAARGQGVALVVNDRADVALIAGADGVHVGQEDLPPRAARHVLGETAIVGRSTHSLAQALRAISEPIDYLAVGPVFATQSKEAAGPEVGTGLIAQVRARTALPLVAIGGISPENVDEVIAAGADGVAVISGLCGGGLEEAESRAALYLARLKAAARAGAPERPAARRGD